MPSTQAKCVLVEAEPLLAANYIEALKSVCVSVQHYSSVRALLRAPCDFDLLVVGIELSPPATVSGRIIADFNLNGFSELRSRWPEEQLVVLSSREDHVLHPSVVGLAADDVLPKRVSLPVFKSHVERVMQRNRATGSKPDRQNANLQVDEQQSHLYWKGVLLRSNITEFDLVMRLTQEPGHTVSQSQMREHLSLPYDYIGLGMLVKVVINKFRTVDPDFRALEVVYGFGYRWVENDGAATESSE